MPCVNVEKCPCTSTGCDNHGICCKCVKRHSEKGNVPFCLRPENINKNEEISTI